MQFHNSKWGLKLWLKAKPAYEPYGTYHSFRSMKRLRVFLLPLDGILVHRTVGPSIHKASCPRTQRSVPGQGSRLKWPRPGHQFDVATAPPRKGVLTRFTVPFVKLLYITKMTATGLSFDTIIVAYLIKSKISVLERVGNCC